MLSVPQCVDGDAHGPGFRRGYVLQLAPTEYWAGRLGLALCVVWRARTL